MATAEGDADMLSDAEAVCNADAEGCAVIEVDTDVVVVALGADEGNDVGDANALRELDML